MADPYSVDAQRRALASASRRHRLVFAALDDPGLRAAAAGEGVTTPVRAAALELAEDRNRALRLTAIGLAVALFVLFSSIPLAFATGLMDPPPDPGTSQHSTLEPSTTAETPRAP